MKEKEKLTELIQYMSEEQCEFVNHLIDTVSNEFMSKGDIVELIYPQKNRGKVDTALPLDYVRRIAEIHPNFRGQFYVYDYNGNTYGEMRNIAEELVLKMQEKFKN
jgi:hypothetical protein